MSEKIMTTREQGIAAIRNGGSFFWNNKQYTKIEDVPSEEEFEGKSKPKEEVKPEVKEEAIVEKEEIIENSEETPESLVEDKEEVKKPSKVKK